VELKCSKQATVPVDKEQVLLAKKPNSLTQYSQNIGTNVDDKDEEVDGDGDASEQTYKCRSNAHTSWSDHKSTFDCLKIVFGHSLRYICKAVSSW
jgi:hypothetical protein